MAYIPRIPTRRISALIPKSTHLPVRATIKSGVLFPHARTAPVRATGYETRLAVVPAITTGVLWPRNNAGFGQ